MTTIEWTDETWNPTTGCTRISAGCKHCYAEGVANRFWGDRKFSDVQFHSERLEQPFRWKKPRKVFVNSMSDLFHESVTDEQLDQIFAVMALTPQHVYQVLTKRPDRMLEYCQKFSDNATHLSHLGCWASEMANEICDRGLREFQYFDDDNKEPSCDHVYEELFNAFQGCAFLPNVCLGVTVENQKAADDRIPLLLQTPAAVRFLSCEPLLEAINLKRWLYPVVSTHNGVGYLNGDALVGTDSDAQINWAIVGGESGRDARPCDVGWIRSIVQQCQFAKVPVFVKQLGSKPVSTPAYHNGTVINSMPLDITGKGGDINEFPEDLKIREFPVLTTPGVTL